MGISVTKSFSYSKSRFFGDVTLYKLVDRYQIFENGAASVFSVHSATALNTETPGSSNMCFPSTQNYARSYVRNP